MGEWEDGLGVARDRGIIDEELQSRLMLLEFDREHKQQGFPMRVALMLLGSIVLLIPLFAVTVRVLGQECEWLGAPHQQCYPFGNCT